MLPDVDCIVVNTEESLSATTKQLKLDSLLQEIIMGTIFSKKEKSRITEQDHAILGLKKQRDQIKQYQKRINRDLEKERELAKKLLKEGKKDRAKLLLRKKKFLEGVLDKTDAQLDQLERMVHDIESILKF